MLAALSPGDLYRLYQILDDLAHMGAGVHLAEELLKSDAPWKTLKSFPLYPRYAEQGIPNSTAQVTGRLERLVRLVRLLLI